jgi:hypothetical protein
MQMRRIDLPIDLLLLRAEQKQNEHRREKE